jgi:hypothetical protein
MPMKLINIGKQVKAANLKRTTITQPEGSKYWISFSSYCEGKDCVTFAYWSKRGGVAVRTITSYLDGRPILLLLLLLLLLYSSLLISVPAGKRCVP